MSVRTFAAYLGVNERTITKWEAGGGAAHPRPELQAALDTALERAKEDAVARFNRALRPPSPPATVSQRPEGELAATAGDCAATSPAGPAAVELLGVERPAVDRRSVLLGAAGVALGLSDAETLRRGFADALDHAAMSAASLDDWEHTVYQYGLAHRYRPAAALLADLTADMAELYRLLEHRRAILVPIRLSRVMAQMAGLMSATLLRLDQHIAARNWARTAKTVASEVGDSKLHAWVLGQEAYSHYYNGNPVEALYAATHAQHVADGAPCSGVALTAALEARVHALFGRADEARAALDRTERALSGMDAKARTRSTFDYDEAKFQFHTGNAHTRLGETSTALAAQDRALALYPENDYFDRALIMLDRADCLVQDNEIPAAAECAAQALRDVGTERRVPVIDNRARQVLNRVPSTATALPAVRELRDIMHSPTQP